MNPHPEESKVEACAEALRVELGAAPSTAIVLGSGLGAVVDAMKDRTEIESTKVGFPQSTVSGHAGTLVLGTLAGERVVAVSGRVHLYEGLPLGVVVRSVRALHRWGVKQILFTASVGGITEGLDPGELVLIVDHLNFQGKNPLTGPAFGTRFPDLTHPYDVGLCGSLRSAADACALTLHEGVYAAMPGPSYETPAEIRMLRLLGADVVGMSTVPEIIAANEIGFRAAAIAVVSNRAAGLSGQALNHSEVTENANIVAKRLASLFETALPGFGEST